MAMIYYVCLLSEWYLHLLQIAIYFWEITLAKNTIILQFLKKISQKGFVFFFYIKTNQKSDFVCAFCCQFIFTKSEHYIYSLKKVRPSFPEKYPKNVPKTGTFCVFFR